MAADDDPPVEPPIYVSPVGALGFPDVGDEDDPGCVGCGKRETLGQHKEPILFEHRGDPGARYWHVSCAEKVLVRVERQHRPHNYAELPTEEQWAIDRKLGLLDEPCDAPEPSDELPIRLTLLGEQVGRELLGKMALSVEEIAKQLNMSSEYFLEMLKAGELPRVKFYVDDINVLKNAWLVRRETRLREMIAKDYEDEEGQ